MLYGSLAGLRQHIADHGAIPGFESGVGSPHTVDVYRAHDASYDVIAGLLGPSSTEP
jgi:hypothetical protein